MKTDFYKWCDEHPGIDLNISTEPTWTLTPTGFVYDLSAQEVTVEMSGNGASLKTVMAVVTTETLSEVYDILMALQKVSKKGRKRR